MHPHIRVITAHLALLRGLGSNQLSDCVQFTVSFCKNSALDKSCEANGEGGKLWVSIGKNHVFHDKGIKKRLVKKGLEK